MDQRDESESDGYSRRQLVATGGALVASALAGCNAFGKGNEGPIKETSVGQSGIVVKLKSSAAPEEVNLIGPDGNAVRRQKITGGQTKVQFPLSTNGVYSNPLAPGEYKVVAINEGEIAQRETIDLTRSFKVTKLSVIEEDPEGDNMGDEPPFGSDLMVEIKNTGNLPVKIAFVGLTAGVPTPANAPDSPDAIMWGQQYSRLKAPSSASTERRKWIGPSVAGQFRTENRPFYTHKSGSKPEWETVKETRCTGKVRTATLEILTADNVRRKYSVDVKYGGKPTQRQIMYADWGCTGLSVENYSQK